MKAREVIVPRGPRRRWRAPWPTLVGGLLLLLLHSLTARSCAETLTLEDCLRETVAHNPEINRARADVERALGQAVTLRARALPQLGVGVIFGYQGARQSNDLRVPRAANTPGEPARDPVTGIPLANSPYASDVNGRPISGQPVFDANGRRIFDTVSGGVRSSETIILGTSNASQVLFDFAIPAAFRRADLEVLSAEHNFAATASTVLHQVRLQFNGALFARDNDVILRQTRGRLGENVRLTQQSFDAGVAARVAVLQARLQVINLSPGLITTEGDVREARVTLLRLMGRPLGPGARPEDLELSGTLDEAGADFDFDAAAARDLALRRRADLRAARDLVRIFQEDTRILRGGYYPLVRLVVNGQYVPQNNTTTNDQGLRRTDRTQTTEFRYGPDFTWNVLDLGAVRGPVRASRAQGQAFAARLAGAEAGVGRDLAGVRARLRAAADRRRALAAGRGAGEATLNAITAGAVQGTSSQFEVLQAQSDLLSNRTQLLQAAKDAQDARAEFDRITGAYLRFVHPGEK